MNAHTNKKIHWDIVILFGILVCCDTATQLFFKQGATVGGEIPLDNLSNLIDYVIGLASNKHVIFGVSSMIIAFFTWLAVISKVDLSKAHLITCLAYVTVPLASVLMLNETINFKQCIGVLLIVLGTYIASERHVSE